MYSVLYQEVLDNINPISGGLYVDGTVGAGGHSRGILQASSPAWKIIGSGSGSNGSGDRKRTSGRVWKSS